MRSRSYLFLLIVLVLAGLSGWLYTRSEPRLGLDVRGGTQITYRMDLAALSAEQRRTLDIPFMEHILLARITKALGVADGTVQFKAPDQWVIELPGFTNIKEAETLLGSTASIKYYHAKTVNTEVMSGRKYEEIRGLIDYNGNPAVKFQNAITKKEILPGTPEYREMIASWTLILEGADLAKAEPHLVTADKYWPTMSFAPSGAKKMGDWCRVWNQRRENLAAVLDDVVLNIAPLELGAIITDRGQITGDFPPGYVKKLCDLLNAGALPVTLNKISVERVDPTIGGQALEQILKAGVAAFCLIAAFLLIYYVFPGFVALVALCLYILFTVTVLKLVGATFSLAAIAGFVLSVGMAVDANILVFERLKEELRAGKTLKAAIDLGFKRALPAIIDSNACTTLTSFVLLALGTGPVKGFATALIFGVFISLFTAVTVTRLMLNFLVGSGLGANTKWYGLSRQWFGEHLEAGAQHKPLAIVEKRNFFFGLSIATIIPGIIFLAMGGIKPNVEFTGGSKIKLSAKGHTESISVIEERLQKAGIGGTNIRKGSDGTIEFVEITAPSEAIRGENVEAQNHLASAAGFNGADVKDGGDVLEFAQVHGTVQAETVRNAILGVVYSACLIVLYLGMRFGFALGGFAIGLRFSIAAIGAMMHDILVVIGMAAVCGYLLGWQISTLFITAMLTMIGFSTHDTIVIFDRIRENLRRHLPGEDIGNLINKSITQSIARSINTSSIVIVTLAFLLFMGSATAELKFFNAVMLFGIVSGTYSSIWNASPILYVIDRWIAKRKGESHTLLGIAAHELARAKVMAQDQDRRSRAQAAEEQYGTIKRRQQARRQGEHKIDED